MSDFTLEQLASAIMERLSPVDGLWSAKTIAKYMDIDSHLQVLNRYAPHPNFPKAIRVPIAGGGRGHPRWKASEIQKWWESHKDSK